MTERFVSEDDWFWSDPDLDLEISIASHVCEPYSEQTGEPNKSGIVIVQRLCRCGRHLSSYVDSIL